jgi:hypothetical protein
VNEGAHTTSAAASTLQPIADCLKRTCHFFAPFFCFVFPHRPLGRDLDLGPTRFYVLIACRGENHQRG